MEYRRLEPFVWEIPIDGGAGMRVPGRVFASDAIMERAAEDKALEQVVNVAALPGIVTAAMAMPDIHWGYGFPIGGVAATRLDDGVVSPGGVGFDIGCGVRLLRSELAWDEVGPRIKELVSALAHTVPRGVGGRGSVTLDDDGLDGVLGEGARWAVGAGHGVDADLELCEDEGALQDAVPTAVTDRARERGASQLGSLGAGNHFLEVQVVDDVVDAEAGRAMGLHDRQVCVMIHSGSRGIGHQTCTEIVRDIDRVMPELDYDLPDRQLAAVPFGHALAERYMGAMNAAGNFARANRQLLAQSARAAFAGVFDAAPLHLVYDISHNLAKVESHDVDGTTTEVCVHRKGATPAFGPGHDGLPAAYRGIGQPVIVPGSMGTHSYVLVGTERSADLSFSSTCHGAGRAMSRTQARKRMDGRALKKDLEAAGIIVAASQAKLLSEEAPYAYKDVSEVVATCEGAGLSRIVAKLRPVGVVKG